MTIKPWRERVGFHVDYRLLYPTAVERAMEQEIMELRARVQELEGELEDIASRSLDRI